MIKLMPHQIKMVELAMRHRHFFCPETTVEVAEMLPPPAGSGTPGKIDLGSFLNRNVGSKNLERIRRI